MALTAALVAAATCTARAHQPDSSYLRITLGREEVEVRFTFDIMTLLRLAPLDANGDLRVSREEVEAGAPEIFEYLRARVGWGVNMRETSLGRPAPVGWPDSAGEAAGLADYHRVLVHFPFRQRVRDMPEDVHVDFDFFGELTRRHRVLGTIIDGEKREEIEFSYFEPDYLFDTGYRAPKRAQAWGWAGAIAGACLAGALVAARRRGAFRFSLRR